MDEMCGFNSSGDYPDKAWLSPENQLIFPSDYSSLLCTGRIPTFGSDELLSAASALSEAPPITPEIQREEDMSTIIKARIASHPCYPRLLEAYIDCQKVKKSSIFSYIGWDMLFQWLSKCLFSILWQLQSWSLSCSPSSLVINPELFLFCYKVIFVSTPCQVHRSWKRKIEVLFICLCFKFQPNERFHNLFTVCSEFELSLRLLWRIFFVSFHSWSPRSKIFFFVLSKETMKTLYHIFLACFTRTQMKKNLNNET